MTNRDRDVLGEMALLTGEARSANAVAKEPVRALEVPAKTVISLTKQHPDLALLMTDVVAKRLGAIEYDALAGKSLGGFRLNRRLGKGGMPSSMTPLIRTAIAESR